MKKLGFGMMRLPLTDPNDAGAIDIVQTSHMVDKFLERGFTYFDTAWMYCGFKSEEAVREALVKRHPRDSFTLADKLHAEYIHTKADRDKVFQEQLRKTGVDYFDYYLMHDVSTAHYQIYQELECFDWLRGLKKKGLARQIGFSFHDHAEVLDRVLTEQPDVDFVQLQLNYLDWESSAVQSRKCYETAVKHGKKVVVMEPVRGGTLAAVPDAVTKLFKDYDRESSVPSWAIRFAASLENVMVVLSGMSNLAQVEDNTGYMQDFKPLTSEEQALVRQAADIINEGIAIPCTGCSYCTEGCPQRIAIPRYFSLYNADLQEVESKGWTPQGEYYDNLTLSFGKASDCIACGQCESVCPQHLPIIEHLKTVAAYFEQ